MELSRLCRFICMFIILNLSLKIWKISGAGARWNDASSAELNKKGWRLRNSDLKAVL